jgi:predicted amidohydrolase YtcJ
MSVGSASVAAPSEPRAGRCDRWLLQRVEVDGTLVDCRVAGPTVGELAPELAPEPGEKVVAGNGGALLPGLSDHHLHVRAAAAARTSVDVTGVPDLAALPIVPGKGWLRLIGADDAVDRAHLDAAFPDRPVRAQHRSGALWTLNAEAVERLGNGLDADERRTGQLWRADPRLHGLLAAAGAESRLDVAGFAAELARLGVTHLTDATPDLDADSVSALAANVPQRLLSLAVAASAPAPLKIVVADHELPDLDVLVARIRAGHAADRPVAVHAVSVVALVLTIAALEAAGAVAGDRIEHAAVCDDATADRIAALDVTVVTQPGIWARRGAEFQARSEPYERPLLWRYGSLLDRGVRVAASSDAPYGDADPWRTIRAAAAREAAERVAPEAVLRSLLADPLDPGGPPRRVQRGAPADLVLFNAPLRVALAQVLRDDRAPVRAVWIGGRPLDVQQG